MNRKFSKPNKQFNDPCNKVRVLLDTSRRTLQSSQNKLGQIGNEYTRVSNIYRNPFPLMDDLDERFKKITGLTGTDIAFLFVATALQIVRQYLITAFPPERMDDKTAAKAVKDTLEKSNRKHRYYCPSLEEILTNPVPFDANMGASKFEGALSGFGSLGHRGATIGHDPVLGLVFGTANIATSTLTNWNLQSYHINTGTFGNALGIHDIFKAKAKTSLVFAHTYDKLVNQGMEGKKIVGASLVKEIIHLKSDLHSKNSLPLPIISSISPILAGDLAKHGLDMANAVNVGKQSLYSVTINTLIAFIHRLLYDPSTNISKRQYEVRTRKILSYSNIIASASNVVISVCTENIHNLDLGGLAVTLYRIVRDSKFIDDVKRDFLKNELHDQVVGSNYDFMEGL